MEHTIHSHASSTRAAVDRLIQAPVTHPDTSTRLGIHGPGEVPEGRMSVGAGKCLGTHVEEALGVL